MVWFVVVVGGALLPIPLCFFQVLRHVVVGFVVCVVEFGCRVGVVGWCCGR